MQTELTWHPAIHLDELPEGRVKTVTVGGVHTLCITHHDGKYSALDNRCPHQGGPLGEGSIENGWLRCPWHGWDYNPCTGRPPEGYDDAVRTYQTKIDGDTLYVGIEEEKERVDTVSDGMVQVMVDWGVTHVFGMVGHSNLGLAEAIRRQVEAGRLTYVGIRHEGAAAFACSAYGKLTGKPAACLTIAGPGATNLLTGLMDAKVDRSPVLALTGQVATQYLGPGNFQECDLAAAFAPVSQFSQTVAGPANANGLMALALKTAITKRDVAHLIFPDEVQVMAASDPQELAPREGRLPDFDIVPSPESVGRAVAALKQSKRPVIIMGHGAKRSRDAVIRFAERIDAPVVTTFKGKGLIPDSHPLACGVLGRSGTPVGSYFMNESDVLLVFGASFSKHTGITTYKTIIQVDFDPMALGKFHAVDIPVWGEIDRTLGIFGAELDSAGRSMAGEVAERWALWREEKASRAADDRGNGISAARIFAELSEAIPADAIIPVDVGNNTYSFGRYFESKGQDVIMSGYLGSIGFALPASLGAWASAAPGQKIVAVGGDGGAGQYLAELTTLVKYNMDVTYVILNNGQLGKISKEQKAGNWLVWETNLVNPNFSEFARNCGMWGRRVEHVDDLRGAIDEGIAHNGPALVEIMQDVDLL